MQNLCRVSKPFLALITLSVSIATGKAWAQANPAVLDVNLDVRTHASGFTTPIGMAFISSNTMFVIEKSTGMVKRVVNGIDQGTVLDLAVNSASERGLLGIALDPSFGTNGFVYLYWTCQAPVPTDPFTPSLTECPDTPQTGADSTNVLAVPLLGNRVDRFRWNGSQLTFDRNLIKLRSFQNDAAPFPPGQGDGAQNPGGNHNGGVIRFGPDGKLYIVMGDNGRRSRMQNLPSGPTPTGQGTPVLDDQFGGPDPDRPHLSGVILRLNPDGSIPADNPFAGAGSGEAGLNLQRVFSYGHRNSFGMAFDPMGGSLWLQENGDDSFDEINRVFRGFNSGWVQLIGPAARFSEFRQIETSQQFFGLQQQRWPPTNLAASATEALSRLYLPAGASYADPQFSWKFAVAPAGIGFQSGNGLGAEYNGDLFVGLSTPALLGGSLLRFDLSSDRTSLVMNDPRLADRVADNLAKNDVRESEKMLMGTNFGIVPDLVTGPNGNLFLVSLLRGTIYELFRSPATGCASNATASVSITRSGVRFNPTTGRFAQTVTIRNTSGSPVTGTFSLAFDSLSPNASVFNPDGTTSCAGPSGSSFVRVLAGPDNILSPDETVTVQVEFTNSNTQGITYTPRLLAGKALR